MPSSRIQKLKEALQAIAPIHFIGVGGSGMAPLASFIADIGIEITGSDASKTNFDPASTAFQIQLGHEDVGLVAKAKTVIASSAIKASNKELSFATNSGKKILHRSDLLALVAESFQLICVTGTHGKSTTSALISFLLTRMGLNPSFIIGAEILSGSRRPTAYQVGSGDFLVIEADESDGTFLKYNPFISVLTNIDPDHMDFYKDMDQMEKAYVTHLTKVDPMGCSVLYWDHARVREVSHQASSKVRLSYGTYLGSDVRLLSFSQVGQIAKIDAMVESERLSFDFPLIGRHNAMNALATLSVAAFLKLNLRKCASELSQFSGVSRRMFPYFSHQNKFIFDDYAHNPVKIKSCLLGLRAAFENYYIVAVFQPHRFSRTQLQFDDLCRAFADVDLVVVLPVYGAGEIPIDGLDAGSISSAISKLSDVKSFPCESLNAAVNLVQSKIPISHYVCISVGAGDVWTVAQDLAALLKS